MQELVQVAVMAYRVASEGDKSLGREYHPVQYQAYNLPTVNQTS